LGVADGQGGLDECGVGESLGVVAEVAVASGVDLLGQEAERVGELQEVGEQLGRLVDAAVLARAWTSQNEQGRKAPSVPGRPSWPGG
jgi:hypothetical protein